MAVSDAYVFPGFLTPVLTQISFQSHGLFSHASADVRGEKTPERNFAWTRSQTSKILYMYCILSSSPPGWLNGEHVGLMTW